MIAIVRFREVCHDFTSSIIRDRLYIAEAYKSQGTGWSAFSEVYMMSLFARMVSTCWPSLGHNFLSCEVSV